MSSARGLVGMLAVVLIIGGLLNAQDTKDTKTTKEPATKLRGQLPQGWSKIGLSDKQKQQIYKTQSEYREKIDVLEQQIKELKEKQQAELVKLLTDEQKTRLKEIISEKSGTK